MGWACISLKIEEVKNEEEKKVICLNLYNQMQVADTNSVPEQMNVSTWSRVCQNFPQTVIWKRDKRGENEHISLGGAGNDRNGPQ